MTLPLPYRAIMAMAGLAALALAYPIQAQVLFRTSSTDGSYCKFKKRDIIEVDTWLPYGTAAEFGRSMTLRRAAEMALSKGFTGFVALEQNCGALLIDNSPKMLRCGLKARMEPSSETNAPQLESKARYSASEVIEQTQAEAPSYPLRSGLLNYKNQCVIS